MKIFVFYGRSHDSPGLSLIFYVFSAGYMLTTMLFKLINLFTAAIMLSITGGREKLFII